MYSESVIQKTLSDFAHREGWMPEPHSIDEVCEFSEYANSLLDKSSNSVNTYYNIKPGLRLTQARRDWHRRWILNEQFMCFSDAMYFLTRYAFICGVGEEVFRYKPRDSQKVLHSIIAEADEQQVAIELFILKARQLGFSTAVAAYFMHRILFRSNTRAVMASVQQKQSDLIGRIQDTIWNKLPFWLPPAKTVLKTSSPEWANGSILSIQSGSQAFGIAQGWTPSAIHISEVGDIPNPKKTLEEGLFRAAHSTSNLFFVMEGTGAGDTGWQAEKWAYYKENWGKGGRFRPVFVPPACAKDLYPLPDWIRAHPIPENWRPMEETKRMQHKSELFIRSTDYLSRAMGGNWKMGREYMWFWECNWKEAVASHTEKVWLSQMPCVTGDTLVSTERGIVRIDECSGAERCESGEIQQWIPKGEKPVIELQTKDGRLLRGTKDHLIKVSRGEYVELGKLSPGTKLELIPPMFADKPYTATWNDTPIYKCERVVDKDIGRLLGYFMGDGCFRSNELDVACASTDQDTIDDVAALIERVSGRKPHRQIVGNMVRVRCPYVSWAPFLRAIGALQPVMHVEGRPDGMKRKVCVPKCIFESPREVVREFLSALFECDATAWKDSPRIELTSSHDSFLREVQLLLLGFGIRARLMKIQKIAGGTVKGGKRHEYTRRVLALSATPATIFYREIGFAGYRKQNTGKRQVSPKYFDDSLVDEVLAVVDTGEIAPVYDINVARAHFFSANGIKVHNCSDSEALQGVHDTVFNDDTIEIVTKGRERGYTPYAITGKTIILGSDNQPYEPPLDEIDYEAERIPIHWEAPDGNKYDWELVPLKQFDDSDDNSCLNKLLIFDAPVEGKDYSIGIDTADGLGMPNEDRSVCCVLRNGVGKDRDEQVASFSSNIVNSAQMARIAACLATLYGTDGNGNFVTKNPLGCKLIIEQIRKTGDECQLQLKIMGFYNHHIMIFYDNKGAVDPTRGYKEGWRTGSWSRSYLLNKFVDALNAGWVKPNCPILIRQLKDFVRIEKAGSSVMGHESGKHDDSIFAIAMAYLTYHDLDNSSLRQEQRYRSEEDKNKSPNLGWASQNITID